MPSIDLFALLGIVLVFVLLGVLFFVPTTRKSRKRKPKSHPKVNLPKDNKDWQAASVKLEKHIYDLRQRVEDLQRADKMRERDLLREKAESKKLKEKLEQERGWHNKEQKDVDDKTREAHRLKKEMNTLEKDLDAEHSSRLKLERRFKELKCDFETLSEAKRGLESEVMSLKAKGDQDRKEMRELKYKNMELSKKQADTTWISKTEYNKVQKKLKDAEKEIEKLKK